MRRGEGVGWQTSQQLCIESTTQTGATRLNGAKFWINTATELQKMFSHFLFAYYIIFVTPVMRILFSRRETAAQSGDILQCKEQDFFICCHVWNLWSSWSCKVWSVSELPKDGPVMNFGFSQPNYITFKIKFQIWVQCSCRYMHPVEWLQVEHIDFTWSDRLDSYTELHHEKENGCSTSRSKRKTQRKTGRVKTISKQTISHICQKENRG